MHLQIQIGLHVQTLDDQLVIFMCSLVILLYREGPRNNIRYLDHQQNLSTGPRQMQHVNLYGCSHS